MWFKFESDSNNSLAVAINCLSVFVHFVGLALKGLMALAVSCIAVSPFLTMVFCVKKRATAIAIHRLKNLWWISSISKIPHKKYQQQQTQKFKPEAYLINGSKNLKHFPQANQ